MSTTKATKVEADSLEERQIRELFRECYEKKFGGNLSKMAEWLGDKHPMNVKHYLGTTEIPARVIKKIEREFPDICEYIYRAGPEPTVVDQEKELLKTQFAELLEDKIIAKHLKVQLAIYREWYDERRSSGRSEIASSPDAPPRRKPSPPPSFKMRKGA